MYISCMKMKPTSIITKANQHSTAFFKLHSHLQKLNSFYKFSFKAFQPSRNHSFDHKPYKKIKTTRMKWGRKKSPLASPSRSSSSSSIFRLPWLSKIKQTRKNFECKPSKAQRDMGCKNMQMPASWKNGRSYGGEDNSDWRLSFEEENYEEEKSSGCLKSVLYDSKKENQELSFSGRRSCQTDDVAGREESLEFNQMLSNIKKLRTLQGGIGGESIKLEGPRRKVEKGRKLQKRNDGDLPKNMLDSGKQSKKVEEVNIELQEKDIFEMKPVKLTRAAKGGNHWKGGYSRNTNVDTIEENYMLQVLNIDKERVNSEWEKLKEMKMKELMAKSEKQRKSVYISSEPQRITTKHTSKVRAYSPRTAYKIECKKKAIENMKRAKKKTEKMMKEKPTQQRTALHNFAVVKSSSDPQSDFRDSMIEMITVQGIKKAEELEELLACYLTLNADQYHETIIKVFRQVWFELILDHLAPGIQI